MSTIPREVNGRDAATARRYYGEPTRDYYEAEKGAGWLTFAAFMLGLAGIIGFIDGLVAVTTSSFYVAGAQFVFSDLRTWGWILMIVGVVATFAAFGVAAQRQWARWTGIFIAGLQAIAQLLMIQAYPFWSLCVFVLDLLVIYGLAVYGGRRDRLDA
jgi:phosphatidylserine synthase